MPSELLNTEKKFLNTLTSQLRGYYLLLLGNQRDLNWLPKNHLYNFKISPTQGNVISHYNNLAIRNNTLDIIVDPYELENTEHPEEVITELHRCLISSGKLFIFAHVKLHPFNWLKKAFSVFKLKNLLLSAGFECKKSNWLHYGSIIIIEAQKNTLGMTPIKPQWEKELILEKEWQPTPTTREIHD